jgi:hypothetical protein
MAIATFQHWMWCNNEVLKCSSVEQSRWKRLKINRNHCSSQVRRKRAQVRTLLGSFHVEPKSMKFAASFRPRSRPSSGEKSGKALVSVVVVSSSC